MEYFFFIKNNCIKNEKYIYKILRYNIFATLNNYYFIDLFSLDNKVNTIQYIIINNNNKLLSFFSLNIKNKYKSLSYYIPVLNWYQRECSEMSYNINFLTNDIRNLLLPYSFKNLNKMYNFKNKDLYFSIMNKNLYKNNIYKIML